MHKSYYLFVSKVRKEKLSSPLPLLSTFRLYLGRNLRLRLRLGPGLLLLFGVTVDQADPAQTEKPAQFHEAQPHRAAAEDQDVVAWLQVEIPECAQHLAPGAQQHGIMRIDVGIHRGLDLKDLDPAMRLFGHTIRDHRLVIVGQHIFAEAAPTRL